MEIDYLSERHRVIVEIYIAEVKKTMYYATDCENVGKYGDFIDLYGGGKGKSILRTGISAPNLR